MNFFFFIDFLCASSSFMYNPKWNRKMPSIIDVVNTRAYPIKLAFSSNSAFKV